jgi:shikimate kinase
MKNEQSQNLILIGYKSSGKSFFGSLLAQELEIPFIDTDQWIEKLYKKEFQEECNCRHISIKMGESGFRMLEERVIDDLKEISNAIIALGGGAILNSENCLKLKRLGRLVYLEADKEILKRRIFINGIPSFLDPKDPENSFERMYEERRPIYEKVSSFKIKLQGKTDRQVLNELMKSWSD